MKSEADTAEIASNKEAIDRLEEILAEPYKEQFVWWEAWRLSERLILTGISVFLINPVVRIFYMAPVIVLFFYVHFRMKPYKNSMFLLCRLDLVSFFCLCLHLISNTIRAIAYVYNLTADDFIASILEGSKYVEQIASPLWYLVVSFLAKKILEKMKKRFESEEN